MKNNENTNLRELLGEARAIHFAMRHGAISYERARQQLKPILQKINLGIEVIAKDCGVKPKYIKFQDLGRSL